MTDAMRALPPENQVWERLQREKQTNADLEAKLEAMKEG